MAWFPKTQSNEISILVSQLNHELGGIYFNVSLENRVYFLNPTNKAISENKFKYISVENLSFADMVHYLSGLLNGLRAGKSL